MKVETYQLHRRRRDSIAEREILLRDLQDNLYLVKWGRAACVLNLDRTMGRKTNLTDWEPSCLAVPTDRK